MAKKKVEEKINLDSILFKCRDILRKARNSGSFFEKRDMMLTLVFLRFIGEKFEDGVAKLREDLIAQGLDPDNEEIVAAFFDDATFTDGTYNLPADARWSTIINTPAPKLNVALDTALHSIATSSKQLKGCFVEGTFTARNLVPNDIKQIVDEVNKISHKAFGEEKDLIGRVYEYFLKEFAVNATKEEGEFYTHICTAAQLITNGLSGGMGLEKDAASAWTLIILIGASILATGFNLYPKIVKWGGAGALVPITGFANSVVSPAIEYKAEGQVFGIGCKIFTIAGPVILYGVLASWVLGVIYWGGRVMGVF